MESELPQFSVIELITRWQFAPAVTGFVVVAAGLYLWGVQRVRRRHPARPWPAHRTALFLGGLAVVVIATESGIGAYDDVLFWDHMVQHLLLLMVAPPLLVLGQPATLLLHASRNPLHTWTKKVLRSRLVTAITWPPFGAALYVGVIVGTHLTGFMNLVLSNETVHDAGAYPLPGRRVPVLPAAGGAGAHPVAGVLSDPDLPALPGHAGGRLHRPGARALRGATRFPAWPRTARPGRPAPLTDVHIGGAVMWVGGAGLMFAIMMTVFFAWTRVTHGTAASAGWRPRAAPTSPPWSARRRTPSPAAPGRPAAAAASEPRERRRRRAPGGLQRLPGPAQPGPRPLTAATRR